MANSYFDALKNNLLTYLGAQTTIKLVKEPQSGLI